MGLSLVSGGRPLSLVSNAENDSPIALELEDLEDRETDSGAECYLVNGLVSGEYRDADRLGGCDVIKTSAKMDVSGKCRD